MQHNSIKATNTSLFCSLYKLLKEIFLSFMDVNHVTWAILTIGRQDVLPCPTEIIDVPTSIGKERFWEDRNNSRKSKVSTNLNFTAELSFYPSPNHHTHRYSLFRNIFQRSVTLIEYRWESRKEINKRSSEEHKSAISHQEGSCLTQKGADQTFTPLSSLLLWVFPSPLLFYTVL